MGFTGTMECKPQHDTQLVPTLDITAIIGIEKKLPNRPVHKGLVDNYNSIGTVSK